MTAPAIEDAAKMLADPLAYTDEVRMHAVLAQLRVDAPVAYVDVPGYRPFWAISRHADIVAIERENDLFINAPRPVLMPAEQEQLQASHGVRTLIHMDDPQHRMVRAVGADWFRPKAMRALKIRVDELARIHVDKMRNIGTECDFAQQVAVNYPLFVIMSLLGVPEADFGRMLKLTQELVGNEDSELQRSTTSEERGYALLEMFEYFKALTAARREQPTDDLGSAIANARLDGEQLSDIDTMSYYVLIATAGHDTTSSVIAGAMGALTEHPEQRHKLCANMDLMPLATEEMIRWVTPVKGMMRTATEDTTVQDTVQDVAIKAGESVLLSYASANRDEGVFAAPFSFDVGRDPNKHLAFGHGVHFCLGAALARMEINSFFSELLPRLESVELNGEPELIATTFVGGLKHLPIRYALR
jgi:cytochrome P450